MSDGDEEDNNMNNNLNEKNPCEEQTDGSCKKDSTLEMVMKELVTMKALLSKVIANHEITTNELTELKITCKQIEKSVKNIEEKDNGSGVFTEPMQSTPLTNKTRTPTPVPLFAPNVVNIEDDDFNRNVELPSADAVIDVDVMNGEGSWSQNMMSDEAIEPFMPSEWLPKTGSDANCGEAEEIPRSDFRRTHAGMLSPGTVKPPIPKRLFTNTPSPSSGNKGKRSNSKGKNKVAETSVKKQRQCGTIIPKGKQLVFRPTNDMDLVAKQVRVCAFLFQRTKDVKIMEERLVKSGELSASRNDLFCLIPTKKISELVMTLMAESIRIAQQHLSSQAVWVLPPSFEADFTTGMPIHLIREKYVDRWMPPYSTLKFIYVPVKTWTDHWYLMIIHIEEATIYHLDSNCPVVATPFRKLRIQKLATLLHKLVSDPSFGLSFADKKDFTSFDIVPGRGLPCTGNSDNSGVWVLDWMSMEHFFVPALLLGTLYESEVRMKSAATLLLGPHNELRAVVKENSKAFANNKPTNPTTSATI